MARTAIAMVALVPNSGTPGGTGAIDPTNGNIITGFFTKTSQDGKAFLLVEHTTVSTKVMTVKAGSYNLDAVPGPAFRASAGDATYTLPASDNVIVGPFESARFEQADGSLWLDFAASATGTITPFYIPKTV